MARRRTGTLITASVLCFCYSVFTMGCGGCGLVGLVALSVFSNASTSGSGASGVQEQLAPLKELVQEMEKELPGYLTIRISIMAGVVALGVVSLIMGIVLLLLKPWARMGTIALGVLVLIYTIGVLTYQFAVEGPAQERANKNLAAKDPKFDSERYGGKGVVDALVEAAVHGGFALAVIILMLVPNTRAAFSDQPPPVDQPDDGWGASTPPPGDWHGGPPGDQGQGGFRDPDR
jgi:hypothetical protein